MTTKTAHDHTHDHTFTRAGMGEAPFRYLGCVERRATGMPNANGVIIGAPGQPLGTCARCGMGIAYCFRVISADGIKSEVGCDCIGYLNDDELTKTVKREYKRLVRERAAKIKRKIWRENRDRERIARLRETVRATPKDVLAALKVDHRITKDIRQRMIATGYPLSQAQMDLVRRIAKDVAERANETKGTVAEGRYVITGTVISVKDRMSSYGLTWKMVVKVQQSDGTTIALWGSIPASIRRAVDGTMEELRGSEVTFTATVSRSNDDDSFGFFSRPSSARIVA